VLKYDKGGFGSFGKLEKKLFVFKLMLLIKLFFSSTEFITPIKNANSSHCVFGKIFW